MVLNPALEDPPPFGFLGLLRSSEWDLWLLWGYMDGFRDVVLKLPETVYKCIRMYN